MIPPMLLTTGAKIGLVLAALTALFLFGVKKGYDLAEGEWQKAALQAAQRTIRVVVQQQTITQEVLTKYEIRKGETRTVFRTIEKEVPYYVRVFQMHPCAVPGAFIRVWNDANRLSPSTPAAAGADEAASPLTLAHIAGQHTVESEQYAELADQLRALQDWIRRQTDLQNTHDVR